MNLRTDYYHLFQIILFLFFTRNLSYSITENIASPFDFRVCETWFVVLREEYMLRSSDSSVLRKNFSPNLGELTEGVRILHKLEFQDFFRSPDQQVFPA
jgi:hypothetical protein